jgi:predicted CoA-binding protein
MNTSENKKTVVIGASPNPERYGYKATEKLVNQGIETIPLGVKPGIIGKSVIINDRPAEKGVHTVTFIRKGSFSILEQKTPLLRWKLISKELALQMLAL